MLINTLMMIALGAAATQTQWVLVSEGVTGIVTYIDYKSIVRRGDMVDVNYLYDFTREANHQRFARINGRNRYDCGGRTIRTLIRKSYNWDGSVAETSGLGNEELINAGTTAETVLRRLCNQ